jgi:hypothetical protein
MTVDNLTLAQKAAECKLKRCPHCKKEQEFYKGSVWCKVCSKEKSREWYYKNKEKALGTARKWALTHPEKTNAAKRKYRENHKDKEREYGKKRRTENPEREKNRKRIWALNNPDKQKAMAKRATTKLRNTPKGILDHRISTAIRETLKGTKNGKRWQLLVGYSVAELKFHIEKRFVGGMSWGKFMSGEIHIDHKIPIAVFNYKTPDDPDFKRCWAIENLQPMWAKDNILKSVKLNQPFQPSLSFG